MAYATTLVANNVLNRAFAEKRRISPMKLQKILYFAAAEYQQATNRPLLSEQFETWKYGPALRSVCSAFHPFGRDGITRFAKNADSRSRMIDEDADPALRRVLDAVWFATRDRSAVELSRITHREDSAWDRAFQAKQPFLESDDIAADDSYRSALGLAAPCD